MIGARGVRATAMGSCLLLALATLSSAQGSPAQVGRWEPPIQWPIVAIHSAVLPTGEVFNLTYLVKSTELETAATVWNPATGRFRDVSPGFGDMFCSGQSFLPGGELFVAGGYGGLFPGKCKAQGIVPTYVFDPFSSSWRTRGNMKFPRFYPTVIALAQGKQLIIGGQGENCQYIPIMEIFDPARGLSVVRGPRQVMRDYPRVFLLSDGSVVQVAPEPVTQIMDSAMAFWSELTVTGLNQMRFEPAAFYVPGRDDRIMVCGGYTAQIGDGGLDDPTASCEQIDPLGGNPSWRPAVPLRQARGDMNAVLLPDGKVLVVGGGAHHRYEGPDLRPELYDPAKNTWTTMAPQRYGRMYHSTAVLLPDGRVLSAGQDDDGSGDGVVSGAWGEIFSPPYLFRGPRPSISAAPASVAYGSDFTLTVSQTAAIESLVLMGLSSVTHSTNVGQRYVPLEFSRSGGANLAARMTANPNLAPPGYYLLFALNDKGVPSEARTIQVTAEPAGATCFKLTRTRQGRRGGDVPTADPEMSADCSAAGEYAAGSEIELTARPNAGWEVAGWTGTDDDLSTLETNRLTMPAANHGVGVAYEQIRTSFDDSFEQPDFCNWSGRECTACEPDSCSAPSTAASLALERNAVSRIEISDERAVDGAHSLKSVYEAANKGKDFLIDTSPGRGGGEARYAVGFRVWPEPGLVVKGTRTQILQANQVADQARTLFEVFLNPIRGQRDRYNLVIQGRADGGQKIRLPAAAIEAGEWRHVRVEWQAASLDGLTEGRIALHLDGVLVSEAALANPSQRVDEVRFGQIKGKKRPTRGAVFFDLFESDWAR